VEQESEEHRGGEDEEHRGEEDEEHRGGEDERRTSQRMRGLGAYRLSLTQTEPLKEEVYIAREERLQPRERKPYQRGKT
jgi:hypothetical protein